MGDVFDRIVGRGAAVPDATGPRVTMRRRPRLGVPARAAATVAEEGHGSLPAEVVPPGAEPPGAVHPGRPPAARVVSRLPGSSHVEDHAPDARLESGERPTVIAPATDLPVTTPEPEASGPEPPTPAVDVRADRPQAPVSGTTPAPAPPTAVPQPDPGRAEVRVRSRRSRSAPASSSRSVSPEELLRDRLAPALVAEGVVDERMVDGLVADGLEPVDVPPGGEVHLHIGRVEVHPPAPAAPVAPEPRPPGRSSDGGPVDHADYLARQQRRWS